MSIREDWNKKWSKDANANTWIRGDCANPDEGLKELQSCILISKDPIKQNRDLQSAKDKLHIIQVTLLLHSNFCSSESKSLNRVGLTAIL